MNSNTIVIKLENQPLEQDKQFFNYVPLDQINNFRSNPQNKFITLKGIIVQINYNDCIKFQSGQQTQCYTFTFVDSIENQVIITAFGNFATYLQNQDLKELYVITLQDLKLDPIEKDRFYFNQSSVLLYIDDIQKYKENTCYNDMLEDINFLKNLQTSEKQQFVQKFVRSFTNTVRTIKDIDDLVEEKKKNIMENDKKEHYFFSKVESVSIDIGYIQKSQDEFKYFQKAHYIKSENEDNKKQCNQPMIEEFIMVPEQKLKKGKQQKLEEQLCLKCPNNCGIILWEDVFFVYNMNSMIQQNNKKLKAQLWNKSIEQLIGQDAVSFVLQFDEEDKAKQQFINILHKQKFDVVLKTTVKQYGENVYTYHTVLNVENIN